MDRLAHLGSCTVAGIARRVPVQHLSTAPPRAIAPRLVSTGHSRSRQSVKGFGSDCRTSTTPAQPRCRGGLGGNVQDRSLGCCSRSRYFWTRVAAAGALRARDYRGAGARADKRCMSSFLVDALRETATSQGINRICNSSTSEGNEMVSQCQCAVRGCQFLRDNTGVAMLS